MANGASYYLQEFVEDRGYYLVELVGETERYRLLFGGVGW